MLDKPTRKTYIVAEGKETMNYREHYYRLGEPIREVVRLGQELIYRLVRSQHEQSWRIELSNRGGRIISALRYGDARCGMKPSYQQSLGELCIELEQERLGYITHYYNALYCPFIAKENSKTVRRDIQWLRTKLYHKEEN